MNNIALFIPDEEAKLFIEFQKHYSNFMTLVENGVFEQKNGAITLHFDANGTIQTIQRADILYSKRIVDKKAWHLI